MKELEGLKWVPRWVTDLGCLKGCLEYLGIEVSDGWLYGASGHGFALNIHDELCPSGPTAWRKERTYKLAENVGCKIETLDAFRGSPGFEQQQQGVWERVKAAIDEGIPCYGWELDEPEYYVINGYSDGEYLYNGCTADEGRKPWRDLPDEGIGVLQIHIVRRGEPTDDRQTLREALEFAIAHNKEPEKWRFEDNYHCGLTGYDQWIAVLQSGRVSKGGMAFNAQVWGECRQKAFDFLKEAADRPGKASASLDEAIGLYGIVADEFRKLRERFAFEPEQWHIPVTDKEALGEAAASLRTARDAEAKALAEFEIVLKALTDNTKG